MGIEIIPIDELVDSGLLTNPSFVKIDVEGAEDKVLLGMRHTLAAAMPVLFVECSEAGRETAWRLLRELGYQCQSAITRKSVNALEEYRHSDFLCFRRGDPERPTEGTYTETGFEGQLLRSNWQVTAWRLKGGARFGQLGIIVS